MSPSRVSHGRPAGEPVEIVTRGARETEALGETLLLGRLRPGLVVALYGGLGSGKTCLVRGLGRALGVGDPVTSPSYGLVHEYRGRVPLIHVDLYRLDSAESIAELGLEERYETGVTAIEWAERMEDRLPPGTLRIRIREAERPGRRRIRIEWGEGE